MYINRFEPGAEPPPPEFNTLEPVPAWKVREEDYRPRYPLPPEEVRHRQIYSALVRAAMAGAIDPDKLALGIRPRADMLLPFAGVGLQQREAYFRQLLNREPTEVMEEAYRRAQEVVEPPELPWPPPTKPRDQQQNSYERLMNILSLTAAREKVPKEAYFSWGDGVSSYYHGPLSRTVGDPRDEQWGLYHATDLDRYPGMVYKRLKATERILLETSFVRLRGIPHLDAPEDLRKIVAALPRDTPVLCFTGDSDAITLRAHPNPSPQHLAPHGLRGPELLLTNLIMLFNLRSTGREISGMRLGRQSDYSTETLRKHLEALHRSLGGAGSGVIRRRINKSHHRDHPHVFHTYFQIADNALVLDARPRLENPIPENEAKLSDAQELPAKQPPISGGQ